MASAHADDEAFGLLTVRYGQWYRLWREGSMWWAEHRDGDKLSASDAPGLELMILDHTALLRSGA